MDTVPLVLTRITFGSNTIHKHSLVEPLVFGYVKGHC